MTVEPSKVALRCIFIIIAYLGRLLAPVFYTIAFFSSNAKRLPAPKQPDILNLSATKLAKKIRNRELTSEQVVLAFVERCRDVNGTLNAIVEDRFAAALEEAKKVDQFINSEQKTKEELEKQMPLLGVPVTVKEACKLNGMSFSVGAKLRIGIRADGDGDAVNNLKKSGVIPIAVTNTPELCASAETCNKVTGYSWNPYDTTRTTGGSSGGEAALLASGASPLGLGSDMAGSIRIPCLYTGIFGHKPSPGIVPNEGHFPYLSFSKDYHRLLNLGPMSRFVEDLKPTLKILAGKNAGALNLDSKVNLKDLKVYYLFSKPFAHAELPIEKDIQKPIKLAVEHLKTTYGCTVEKLELEEINELTEICLSQLADMEDINKIFHLKGSENESNVYVELVKALTSFSDYCLTTMACRLVIELLSSLPERLHVTYAVKRNKLNAKLKAMLGPNRVLILPSFGCTAFHKNEMIFKISTVGYSLIANVFGFPATQIPAGLNKKGLPVGFQVVAGANQDRLCLAVAEEFEKVFGGWVPPPSA